MNIQKIIDIADYKELYQFPIIKVGFKNGSKISADSVNVIIHERNYVIEGDLPLYDTITANISSNRHKLWCVGLSSTARRYFESMYVRVKALANVAHTVQNNKNIWHGTDTTDYYNNPEDFGISFFPTNS